MLRDPTKRLKEYDDITPYEHNQNSWSTILINLLLSISPQIEAVTKVLVTEFNLTPPQNSGIKGAIKEIDRIGVLSNIDIKFKNRLPITPFTNYAWWDANNDIKHDLLTNIHRVDFEVVMKSFAALSGLHKIAWLVKDMGSADPRILDPANWQKNTHKYFYVSAFEINTHPLVLNP
jgi:hypothetical protein